LQRAAILTSDKFRGVRWFWAMEVSDKLQQYEQEEAQEELDVPYKGETLDIGFNVGYLVDVLNNLDVAESSADWAMPIRARSLPCPGATISNTS